MQDNCTGSLRTQNKKKIFLKVCMGGGSAGWVYVLGMFPDF